MGAFLAWWVSLRVLARPYKHEESEQSMMSWVRVSGGPHVGGTCVWGGVDTSVDLVFSGWVAGREKLNLPFFGSCFQLQFRHLMRTAKNFKVLYKFKL